MKKKIFALTLALILMMCMTVPAFATITTNGGTNTTTVKYLVAQSFTVTIPAEVTVGGSAVEVKIDANPVIPPSNKISVKITNAANKLAPDNFRLLCSGDYVNYTITKSPSGTVNINDEVLSQPAAATTDATASLTFALDGTPKYADNYTDTLTFTASVVSAS